MSDSHEDLDLERRSFRQGYTDFHPVFNELVTFLTTTTDEVYRRIRSAILIRAESLWFEGATGAGKTFAQALIAELLRQDFPTLAVARLVFHGDREKEPMSSLYLRFLSQLGYTEPVYHISKMKRLFSTVLANYTQAGGLRLIVLFVDEAHELKHSDFVLLRNLGNDLRILGFRLVIFFFGEWPYLSRTHDEVSREEPYGLPGRFFGPLIEFKGLISVEDIRRIFGQFDTECYPNALWPFTRWFFKEAWDSGFRMLDAADSCYVALADVADPSTLKLGVALRTFFIGLRYALLAGFENDRPGFTLTKAAWAASFREAGLTYGRNRGTH